MDADELRKQLVKIVERRRKAEKTADEATHQLAELLRQVGDTDGITMVEAAKIIGVSRQQAHNMLKN